MSEQKKILVVAAHPDDEALGCAGAIARHCQDGDDVHVVFLADGEGARGDKDNLSDRRQSSFDALKALGVQDDKVEFYDFPDNAMDQVALLDVTKTVEGVISKTQPHIVYTHHENDLNVDHRVTHQGVMTACRPMPGFSVVAIYTFEVLSSTEWATPNPANSFVPNFYVDISSTWSRKLEALKCYNAEMRAFPHSRSFQAVEALAVYRGASVGVEKAEAFQIVRKILR